MKKYARIKDKIAIYCLIERDCNIFKGEYGLINQKSKEKNGFTFEFVTVSTKLSVINYMIINGINYIIYKLYKFINYYIFYKNILFFILFY